MTKAHPGALSAAIVALGLMIGVGAGVATAGPATIAIADGALTTNPGFITGPVANTDVNDPANPAIGAEGRVHLTIGVSNGNRTNATLRVSGLPAGRTFGAHLHRDDCAAAFGGPHYQHANPVTTPPGTPVATASPENEVWLDITTNPSGRGSTAVTVPFSVLAGMRSVVVHQLPTNNTTLPGNAGQRIGCLPIAI